LRVVLALAAEGSTAGAGAVLHLTQSAVSRALLLAEDKLGVRLFERSARGLCPTSQGERLIAGAGPLLAQLAELEAVTRSPVQTRAPVRLVCECYTAYRWLPSALAQLRERLPELTLELAVEHTGDPAAALARGDIDVALLTTAPTPPDCAERPLFSDEIVFVLAPSHPLAQRPHLSAKDLQATTLITSNTPPAERKWFMTRVFGRRRPKLDFLTLPLTEAMVDAARAGMGVAVLSEWIASSYLGAGDLLAKRFGDQPLRRPWRIAFRPSAADAASRLAGALEGLAPRVYPVSLARHAKPASASPHRARTTQRRLAD
jgi:LysR family transcriptional regulator, regulator for metE and metH